MFDSSSEYILTTSKEYSVYICSNRAIPKIADGLKDSQRKALWLIRNKNDKIKTVSLSGEMLGSNLYVHGDQSAAATISLLAAPYCNNVPLLEGVGAFGTRVAPVEGIGAPRYTYVKRGKALRQLLYADIEIVPTKENYDGSNIEPIHFLPLIPLVLLNGVSGIASGWSTEILPRSFNDLVEASIAILDNKPIQQLKPTYSYLTCNANHLEGNTWEFTGRVKIVDTSTVNVTELPPDLTLEKFKEKLNIYEDEGKINSYVDRSTKTIDITVKFPRGSIKDWTEDQAIEFLKLKQKKTERIVVIDWNCKSIRQYESAEQVIYDFIAWRLGWFTVRYQTLLDHDNVELLYWKAIRTCFEQKLPSRIGSKQNKKAVEDDVLAITKAIPIDAAQLDRIVSLPSYKWAQDYFATVLENISLLEKNITQYQNILSSEKMIKSIYRKELLALRSQKF